MRKGSGYVQRRRGEEYLGWLVKNRPREAAEAMMQSSNLPRLMYHHLVRMIDETERARRGEEGSDAA